MGSVFFKKGSEKLNSSAQNFFDFKVKDITGKVVDFSTFKNKKAIMVVNVACKWGLTSSNYTAMVDMHKELKDQGFEILAFPCNQFFGQESGSPEEIKKFVDENFKAEFPIFEKVEVNGDKTHPLFVFLRNNSELFNKKTGQAEVIPWNFAKFLINSKGEVVSFFKPSKDISDVRKAVVEMLKWVETKERNS